MNPLLKSIWKGFTILGAFLYRASGGRLGGQVQGLQVLLLTTIGRHTRKLWTTPIGYTRDGNAFVVVASNAGQARHPGWYLNLQRNPKAQIQVGTRVMSVRAEITQGDQHQRLWSQFIAAARGYAAYQTRTTREIPLVLLAPDGA